MRCNTKVARLTGRLQLVVLKAFTPAECLAIRTLLYCFYCTKGGKQAHSRGTVKLYCTVCTYSYHDAIRQPRHGRLLVQEGGWTAQTLQTKLLRHTQTTHACIRCTASCYHCSAYHSMAGQRSIGRQHGTKVEETSYVLSVQYTCNTAVFYSLHL